MQKVITKWNIYIVDFGKGVGSEQCGIRPSIVIQNAKGNLHSPTTICVPITSKSKNDLPTHHTLYQTEYDCLSCEVNTVLCEQVRVVDKSRVLGLVGQVKLQDRISIEKCLKINFDL